MDQFVICGLSVCFDLTHTGSYRWGLLYVNALRVCKRRDNILTCLVPFILLCKQQLQKLLLNRPIYSSSGTGRRLLKKTNVQTNQQTNQRSNIPTKQQTSKQKTAWLVQSKTNQPPNQPISQPSSQPSKQSSKQPIKK